VVVIDVEPIRERFSTVAPFLDERGRRLVAAAEAFAAGYGGIAAVALATGLAPSTIGRGLKELAHDEPSERVRRPGAGRKPALPFISQNWRAQPLVGYRVIVELISATTTKTGLTVRCELDPAQYPKGIVVSDAEMAAINIKRAEFHGEWNYTISPNTYPPNCAFIS
jgi:Rhodopirellula transposase DDE domain